MKRIISFGDSFTLGLGTDRIIEDELFKSEDDRKKGKYKLAKFQRNNSFTKFFADKFKSPFKNTAVPGCSNKNILDSLINWDMKYGLEKDDFVLIGFTSSYRDKLPFFPDAYNDNVRSGFQWSMKELPLLNSANDIFFWDSKLTKRHQDTLNEFMKEYLKFYMVEVFDDSYWQIYNSNLIVYIQKFLEFKKVKYIMFDAFEPMLNDIPKFVNKKTYWGCAKQNIYSFLKQFNDDVYELDGWNVNEGVSRHPSIKGHKLFTEELYRFYNEIY